MRRRYDNEVLIFLAFAVMVGSNAVAQDAATEPAATEIPGEVPSEQLTVPVPSENAPISVEVIGETYQRPNHERRDLPAEGQQLIRSIALILLPQKFDDEDGWGDEKRIQSGLNVDFDDGRIKTSRRWNSVNHGSWLQGSGELVDPENTFTLKATQLPDPDDRTQRYEVSVSAKMRVRGRQQQWNYGVMIWSVSADATADISLHAAFDVTSEVVTTDKGSRLRFLPNVTSATARLENFKLHRVSHAKGTAVKGIGELVEELIQLRLKRENKDLAARINKAIQKKPDRLEIPFDIGGWLGVSPSKKPEAVIPSSPDSP